MMNKELINNKHSYVILGAVVLVCMLVMTLFSLLFPSQLESGSESEFYTDYPSLMQSHPKLSQEVTEQREFILERTTSITERYDVIDRQLFYAKIEGVYEEEYQPTVQMVLEKENDQWTVHYQMELSNEGWHVYQYAIELPRYVKRLEAFASISEGGLQEFVEGIGFNQVEDGYYSRTHDYKYGYFKVTLSQNVYTIELQLPYEEAKR